MIKILSISFFLIIVFSETQAADLKIGPVTLSPGMEQSDALEALRSHFHIHKVLGARSIFFLSESKSDKDSPIASLAFENGRISWIEKNWGAFSGRISPVKVTKALTSAMESAKIASGESTEVNTNIRQNHNTEFKELHFVFSDRKVIVVTTNGDVEHGQHVRIYERVDGIIDAQHDDFRQLSEDGTCISDCPDKDYQQESKADENMKN